jgi:hypothetical protein
MINIIDIADILTYHFFYHQRGFDKETKLILYTVAVMM